MLPGIEAAGALDLLRHPGLHRDIFSSSLTLIPIPSGLRCIRPTVGADRTRESNAPDKGASTTAWAPCPSSSAADGEMVHVETNPGKHNPHGGSEENVECVVAVIGPSRRGDEEGRRGRHEREDHHQDWRRGPALAH